MGELIKTLEHLDRDSAETFKRESLWKTMALFSLEDLIQEWLTYMTPRTKRNYLSGIRRLSSLGILDLHQSIQDFSFANHDTALDRIANVKQWSDCSRQTRAAIYISLTRFISRKTEGMAKRAIPRTGEANRTFFRVREKVKTEALDITEWTRLIKSMETINHRDALIAKLCLQGARRIQEVLDVQIEQVNRFKRQILFRLNKTRGVIKDVIVTIPHSVFDDVLNYIGHRSSGYVFITSRNKPVYYTQVLKTLKKAAVIASINKRMHTHVLRTSAITHLRSLGFQDFEIQRLTGHSSSQMLNAYDKTSLENNTSQKVSLV